MDMDVISLLCFLGKMPPPLHLMLLFCFPEKNIQFDMHQHSCGFMKVSSQVIYVQCLINKPDEINALIRTNILLVKSPAGL